MKVIREGGARTPQIIAQDLERLGHLESIVKDPFTNGTLKYFTLDVLHDYGLCAEVTEIEGRVVSVRNVSEDILRTLPPIEAPMFGGF